MIICLKGISEECFLLNVNVNTSLKCLWGLRGLSEGIQSLAHSEGTQAFRALSHLGTQGTRALGHSRKMLSNVFWVFNAHLRNPEPYRQTQEVIYSHKLHNSANLPSSFNNSIACRVPTKTVTDCCFWIQNKIFKNIWNHNR